MSTLKFEELNSYLNNYEKCKDIPKRDVLFLGPPGSGKGTQARMLAQHMCYCHLSSGDLLREAIKNGHPAGQKAKELMDKGQLVSNEISVEVITPVVNSLACSRGIIFDGFPRELDQLPLVDQMLKPLNREINTVFEFTIDEKKLFDRISGRWIHLSSGRTYHSKYNPPKKFGVDDVTGEKLIQRNDDNPTALKTRIDVYNKKTQPLVDYYKEKGILKQVDSFGTINKVFDEIKSHLL